MHNCSLHGVNGVLLRWAAAYAGAAVVAVWHLESAAARQAVIVASSFLLLLHASCLPGLEECPWSIYMTVADAIMGPCPEDPASSDECFRFMTRVGSFTPLVMGVIVYICTMSRRRQPPQQPPPQPPMEQQPPPMEQQPPPQQPQPPMEQQPPQQPQPPPQPPMEQHSHESADFPRSLGALIGRDGRDAYQYNFAKVDSLTLGGNGIRTPYCDRDFSTRFPAPV
jgi:hypothetical protein